VNALTTKLDLLQDRLENAAFLASQGSAKEAHSEIFRCTAVLSEIRQLCMTRDSTIALITIDESEADEEVKKVRNRLRHWASRQSQTNSRILNAFLKLEKFGAVTESALKSEFAGANFATNFAQMKIIADRNHGKIFDQRGDVITLWPPIVAYVREYEKARHQ